MNRNSGSIFQSDNLPNWLDIRRCYAINFSVFEMKPHYHYELEIMYAVHGKCKIICWNDKMEAEEYHLKEGEYILIDSNIPHQLEVSKDNPCRILNLEIAVVPSNEIFKIDMLYGITNSLEKFLSIPIHAYKSSDNGGSLYRIIAEIQKQIMDCVDQQEHHIQVNLLLSQLLVELSRQRFRRHNSYQGSTYVKRALSFIEKNFEEDMNVEEIAKAIGVSVSHLQRLFKEQTGVSIIDKINEFRINKAKLLLESGCLPVVDIALTVGFHNRQHFTYTFTKIVGCSPCTYKKSKGNQQQSQGFGNFHLYF